MAAVQPTDTIPQAIDKWAALEMLTQARDDYGLSHRTLGVLRSLMTCLPERLLTGAVRSAMVFASNATLSKRLNGMPESTLRRHLGALVQAGIVSRHDSANRKRFARRTGQGGQLAFGFDLSPIARMVGALTRAAEAATARAEHLAALRAQVAAARQQVLQIQGVTPLTEEARLSLRRTPDEAALTALLDQLTAEEMSTTDSENERHIEQDLKSKSVREEGEKTAGNAQAKACVSIVAQCSEYKSYFPDAPLCWAGLSRVADRLCPMMGIDQSVYVEAVRKIGLVPTVTAVLCILEKLGEISNPGGFLRRLAQRGEAGHLCLKRLAEMVQKRENCQLTILEPV